jgi:hypothetical protein
MPALLPPEAEAEFARAVAAYLRGSRRTDLLAWVGIAPEVALDDDPEAYLETVEQLCARWANVDGTFDAERPTATMPAFCFDDFPESELVGRARAVTLGEPWPPPDSNVHDLGDD